MVLFLLSSLLNKQNSYSKVKEMPDINNTVTKNFHENIAYFQVEHPKLFSKLVALESAIEQGHYQERYELVYENDGFDVLEKSSGNFLYDKKSISHAKLASKSVDYSLDDNLFQGFHKQNITDEELKKYNEYKPFEHHMSGFAAIMHTVEEDVKTLKTLYKYIFFGSGLGLHISSIDEKINAKVYLIIEDDLELFRLSLFCTNYKDLASHATLVFSVFEDNEAFYNSVKLFLDTEYYYNHYIKYFHILSHANEKIKQFQIAISSQSHLLFFYNTLLRQYLKPLEYLFEEYKFLHKSLRFDTKEFDVKPFLLVAAGPSLEKNMDWLKENHTNFTLVALSATLSILENEGIAPDIVTHLDAFDTAKIHFTKLKSLEFIKDAILIYSSRIPRDVVTMFEKKQLFFLESGTHYKEDSLKPSAPCVGSLTYQLLLRLKAKSIYLLGLDLAIDSQTGKTHSGLHEYAQTLEVKDDSDASIISFKESLFHVEGNFRKSVLTTPNFKISIDAINNATKLLKDEAQKVYNLNDGAKFVDSIPMKADNIKINQTSVDIKNHLFKLCSENSSVGLSNVELNALRDKLQHAKLMQITLLKYKELKKSKLTKSLEDLKELSATLCTSEDMQKYELSRVLDTYLKYILSYVFDYFNHETPEKNMEAFEKLDLLLTSHLLKIVDIYHDTLKEKGSVCVP